MRFWNNLHQVRSKLKHLKPNNLNVLRSNKAKGPKQDSQKQDSQNQDSQKQDSQHRLSKLEGGEP